jgi:hypothetical protein
VYQPEKSKTFAPVSSFTVLKLHKKQKSMREGDRVEK